MTTNVCSECTFEDPIFDLADLHEFSTGHVVLMGAVVLDGTVTV